MTEAAEKALFAGHASAWSIWKALKAQLAGWPDLEIRVQKSQIGLWAGHPFAAVWLPGMALGRKAAPVVLSVFARERLEGPWKEVIESVPGRFTHHAELFGPADLSPALLSALSRACASARAQ